MNRKNKLLLLTLILIVSNVIEASCSCVITIIIARHRDCKGFGFCRWTGEIRSDDAPEENKTKAIADLNDEGHLVLTINKKLDLSEATFDTYFSKGVFICEDDFPVPGEVLKSLGYSESYTIQAGKYPITRNGDNITIEF